LRLELLHLSPERGDHPNLAVLDTKLADVLELLKVFPNLQKTPRDDETMIMMKKRSDKENLTREKERLSMHFKPAR
jgi:hypothetical protein